MVNISDTALVKITVNVPETHADTLREALAKAGAGKLGNYSSCSFSVKGVGRFKPEQGSHPAIGEMGKLEEVIEEQIQVLCPRADSVAVVAALRAAHPYEEPAYSVCALEDI